MIHSAIASPAPNERRRYADVGDGASGPTDDGQSCKIHLEELDLVVIAFRGRDTSTTRFKSAVSLYLHYAEALGSVWIPYGDEAHQGPLMTEVLMDIVFVALGAAVFLAFAGYAALLGRV